MGGKLGKTEKCLLALAAGFFLLTGTLQLRDADRRTQGDWQVVTEKSEDFQYELPEPCNVNTATAEELTALPGIGQVLAERIIAYREAYGGFQTVEELMEVDGIGEKKLNELRDRVTVGEEDKDPPAASAGEDSAAGETAGKGESDADPGSGR